MADFRAIMALLFKDRSYREIVEAVGCSHRDVSTVRKAIPFRGRDDLGRERGSRVKSWWVRIR